MSEDKFIKARQATEALESISWAFDEVRAVYVKAIFDSTPDKAAFREEAYRFVRNIDALRGRLQAAINGQAIEVAMQESQDE